jgi:hypothetical protein
MGGAKKIDEQQERGGKMMLTPKVLERVKETAEKIDFGKIVLTIDSRSPYVSIIAETNRRFDAETGNDLDKKGETRLS